jgi:nucleoid DNA-binding protein
MEAEVIMGEYTDQLPEGIRAHLAGLVRGSGLPDTEGSLEALARVWLQKTKMFEEQIRALDMQEAGSLDAGDPRGALLLSSSASLLTVGPLDEAGRRVEYASIQLRTDVPHLLVLEGAGLAESLALGREARFSGGPIQSTSALLKIAVCGSEVGREEQEKRLREATIFLTNGFVKLNRTLAAPGTTGPEQFNSRSLITYLARRSRLSQKRIREILADYHCTLEAGLLLGERVRLGRIGTFYLKKLPARKARVGINPATREKITIRARPEQAVPRLAFSRLLKERARQVPLE